MYGCVYMYVVMYVLITPPTHPQNLRRKQAAAAPPAAKRSKQQQEQSDSEEEVGGLVWDAILMDMDVAYAPPFSDPPPLSPTAPPTH